MTQLPGDNDPIDVIELSPEPIAMGEVILFLKRKTIL